MAYVAYSGLSTPNEVVEKIAEYVASRGYTITQPVADDLNIYDMSYSDGKKFAFEDRTGQYHIVIRAANGTQIFGTNDTAAMDVAPIETDIDYTGVGMIVGEGYSSVQRWYNQYKVPVQFGGNDTYGVFMPMKVQHMWESSTLYHVSDIIEYSGSYYECINEHTSSTSFSASDFRLLDPTVKGDAKKIAFNQPFTYTLYCNNVTTPTDSIVFSLEKENDKYHQVTHLIFGIIDKFDSWDGGAIFSGSSIKSLMGDDVKVYEHDLISDQYILPVLSSGSVSNSFLRADIDEAPTEIRGSIYWASSGSSNETGKKFALPIRLPLEIDVDIWDEKIIYGEDSIVFYLGDYYKAVVRNDHQVPYDNPDYWELTTHTLSPGGNGKIPHYFYLQSRARRDWGRNINTLNCITIDMPIFAAVLVDPDVLDNYAAVGNVSGIYCVSTLNMQTAHVYERSYPRSGDLDQVFPHGKRRGYYGFDGISIKQMDYT